MGYKSNSSGKVFDDYIAGGPAPTRWWSSYENQLIEWIIADPERWGRVAAAPASVQPVALYPTPTVYSAHPLLALMPPAILLIDALMSARLQTIAWRDHEFRGPLGAVGADADTDPAIKGRMPSQLTAILPMPDMTVMLKILDALA